MAEPSSSSSSASSSRIYKHDVFLNFRGKDTRKNFTGFLYSALVREGIDVFIDSKNLRIGEAITPALSRAIEGSKISISIFSNGYASSKWCLQELYQISNCYKSSGQLVFPIFLDIDPTNVRNQTGSFEASFQEHEKNFDPDIVGNWREALKMVGNLKGWVLNNGDQSELIQLVVGVVLDEINSSTHMAEYRYPIGLDFHVDLSSFLLNCDSDGVWLTKIYGIDGIGKKIIAKTIYNRPSMSFEGYGFPLDSREEEQRIMGLMSLQKQLLKKIFKTKISIDGYSITNLIKQIFSERQFLIILDDVDKEEQIDALMGEVKWFEGNRFTISCDLLYSRGFDRFGIKLHGKDALENLYIQQSKLRQQGVKYFKFLFKSREPDQKKPNQSSSSKMVADFFNWPFERSMEVDQQKPNEHSSAMIEADFSNCLFKNREHEQEMLNQT